MRVLNKGQSELMMIMTGIFYRIEVQRKVTFVDKVGNNINGIVGFTDYGKTSLVTERNSKEQLIDFTIPVNKAGYSESKCRNQIMSLILKLIINGSTTNNLS